LYYYRDYYNTIGDIGDYYNTIGDSIGYFNTELEKYIYRYNNYRPHVMLDLLTSKEYYLKLVEMGNFVPNVFGF
jgi:hypothetical protein